MNSRIEPEAQAGTERENDQAGNSSFAALVQMTSASPLTVLIGPRSEATSRFARSAAIACAEQHNPPAEGTCGDVVVIFDQWSGDPLVTLGDTIAAAVDSATGVLITRPHPDPRTLAELLAHWTERFGADFIIVLDQYERNLAAEPLNGRNARFAEQLAEAIANASAHARFLVVVSRESESALVRLTARLGGPCKSVVRLAGATMTNQSKSRRPGSDAATARAGVPDEPLPKGFSALADDHVDRSATEALLRRRERRKTIARWRNVAAGATLLIAAAAGITLFQRLQAPDPGARLAHALDPQPSPAVPTPTPASIDKSPGNPQVAVPAADAGDTAQTGHAPPPTATPINLPEVPGQPRQPAATTAPAPAPVESAPANLPPPAATPDARPEPALDSTAAHAATVEAPRPTAPKHDPLPPAFRVDASPGPPMPAKLVRAVANPEKEPMLFIHIRSESQRAQARNLASGLARLSIVVSGIRIDEAGPIRGDLRYYRSGERDEANYLGRALGRLGAPALRVTQVAGHEAEAVPRHYELWLPPPTR